MVDRRRPDEMQDRELFERRLGTVLRDKWKLERLLGVGGMAAVYLGVHKIGRRDAIKILHPEVARNRELCERFEREAHAVNRLTHPGAVEIRDVDVTEDGAPFLVMELLTGESLSERARRQNGLELGELLRVTDDLLDVLDAAHEQGIVHRDIKLDNLFLQTDGTLKVLDFGIARIRDGATKMLTRIGARLGTVAYMPPEQVRGDDIDHRADLFAVGATMFRVIGKRRIHDAPGESELLIKMGTLPAPPLASVASDAPHGVCLVVDRALAFHRERRYPDARTMQRDVQALRRGEEPPHATARLSAGELPSSREPPGAPPSRVVLPDSAIEATVVHGASGTPAVAAMEPTHAALRSDPTRAAPASSPTRVEAPPAAASAAGNVASKDAPTAVAPSPVTPPAHNGPNVGSMSRTPALLLSSRTPGLMGGAPPVPLDTTARSRGAPAAPISVAAPVAPSPSARAPAAAASQAKKPNALPLLLAGGLFLLAAVAIGAWIALGSDGESPAESEPQAEADADAGADPIGAALGGATRPKSPAPGATTPPKTATGSTTKAPSPSPAAAPTPVGQFLPGSRPAKPKDEDKGKDDKDKGKKEGKGKDGD